MRQLVDPIRGDTEPDRLWTLTNIAEATPLVLTPLEWSFWAEAVELGGRGAWCDFGLLPPSQVRLHEDQNDRLSGCFYGRQALNVDLFREIIGIVPGRSADELERDILGVVRPDLEPVPNQYRRFPVIAWKTARILATQTRAVALMHAEQTDWWRTQVLDGAATDPWALLDESARRFVRVMRVHARTRTLLQAVQSLIGCLCERIGGADLPRSLFSGYGSVVNTAIADKIWMVSRGRMTCEQVIREHGFLGPNGGNQRSRSWREDPSGLEGLVEAIGRRAENDRPRVREQLAVDARLRAERTLLEDRCRMCSALVRPLVRPLLRLGGTTVRNLELGKSAYLSAVDGTRAAARAIGAWLHSGGLVDDPEDVFYLTRAEVQDSDWPEDRAELIRQRRRRHEEYETLTLPVTFVGMPKPIRVSDAAAADGPEEITGVTGAPGRVWGRARVVHDPAAAPPLDEGEILVCRTTDPGWVALVALADGLVIDIGGPTSHGAIVARELGVPCVIGTRDGTRRLRTGDRVEVDGDSGVVTVLQRCPSHARRSR